MSKKVLISIVDDNQCFREALEALMISIAYEVAALRTLCIARAVATPIVVSLSSV
jgi:FixJ family two-component response regulator